MTDRNDAGQPLDLLTVFAIAIIAYIAANVLHEGVGHAGVCAAVGCQPLILTTAHVDWQIGAASEAGARLIAAGGTLVNLIAALVFWLLLRSARSASGAVRYFLWLSMAVNLLVGTGYFLFSGVISIGDWMDVVEGWQPAGLWRALLIAAGIVLYLGAIAACIRTLAPLVGGGGPGADRPGAIRRAVQLTTYPYFVGSIASTLGALLNPEGMILVATSAAAHFGGTSGLAWMAQMLKTRWFPLADSTPIAIPRRWGWIAAAVVLLVVHIAVLGPGIRF